MKKIVDYNLHHQLLIYIIVPIILLFLFQLPYIFYVLRMNEETSADYVESNLNITYDNMSRELNAIKRAGDSLAYSMALTDFLYEENYYKRFEALDSISDIFSTIENYSSSIESVFLANKENSIGLFHGITYSNQLGDIDKIYTELFLKQETSNNGDFFLFHNSDDKYVLIYVTGVVPIDGNDYVGAYRETSDMLIFFINIKSLMLTGDDDITYYLADSNGNILVNNEFISQEDFKEKTVSNKYLMSLENPESGIKLYASSNLYLQNDYIVSTGLLLMLSILAAILSIIIIGYMWNRNIVRPLVTVSKEINEDTTILNYNFTKGPDNQIGRIIEKLNEMMERNRTATSNLINMQSQIFEAEIAERELRYIALKNQINPHFLYNTLASIKGMARIYDAPIIADQCQAVSDILRYSLKGKNMVSLREELEIIKQYISIMSIRFEGKFIMNYNINTSCLNENIVKMSLQPLIENCINHGFEDIDEGGEISISVLSDDEYMTITISDNGCGFSDEEYEKVHRMLLLGVENDTEGSDSIGIANIDRRLKLALGKEYGLIIEKQNKGSTIKMRYPLNIKQSSVSI